MDKQIEKLKKCELLTEKEITDLCRKASEIFRKQPNIVAVPLPVNICGDVHGQFNDVLEIFEIAGHFPVANYLFLGDYVDRGYHSVETFLLLLLFKLRYPTRLTLIRGNHEARKITQAYGFYDECFKKFGSATVWKCFTDLFDTIPLGAMVGGRILGIHGGLSPEVNTIDEIRSIEREKEIPLKGPMCDILWSDPGHEDAEGWAVSSRGAGFLFGRDVTEKFVWNNGLDFIARAHQLVHEGYRWHFRKTMVTVWSAPNYCYRCGNLAAILQLNEHCQKTYLVFDAAPSQFIPQSPQIDQKYFI